MTYYHIHPYVVKIRKVYLLFYNLSTQKGNGKSKTHVMLLDPVTRQQTTMSQKLQEVIRK